VDLEAKQLSRPRGRFLFGSDSPNNPTAVEAQVDRIRAMGLGEVELEMVLGGTAMRLAGRVETLEAR